MPLICPQCGAQNPEDMLFCQQCGTRLAATPGAATPQPGPAQAPGMSQAPTVPITPASVPPAGYVPPAAYAPPAGYAPPPASGYYRAAPAPVHRLPLATILGITIGVLVLAAATAVLAGRHGPNPPPPPPPGSSATPVPSVIVATATVPRSVATATPVQHGHGPLPPGIASATPVSPAVASPSAVVATATVPQSLASATPQPPQPTPPTTPPNPGAYSQPGRTIATSTFSLRAPTSWQQGQVNDPQNEVLLQDPNYGPNLLDIYSGQVNNGPTDAQSLLGVVLSTLRQTSSDAAVCSNNPVQETIGGISGTEVAICFTYTPPSGAAISAVDLAWAATDASGNIAYVVGRTAARANLQAFLNDTQPVLNTLQWAGGQ